MIKTETIYSDFAVAPGVILAEELEARGMTQKELALRAHRPPQAINEIVQGKKEITPETALALEKVLGIPASFWSNLEARYRMTLAQVSETARLEEQAAWLAKFPIKEIEKLGWIPKHRESTDKVKALLKFLGIAEFADSWSLAATGFRITGGKNISEGALSVWLRKGLIEAQDVDTQPYEISKFRKALRSIRTLTAMSLEQFEPQMKELCVEAGVALVLTPELPKVGANGATRWLSKGKGVIQLNLKYKWADIFWFTFFHEAWHLLSQRHTVITVDGLDGIDRAVERKADTFACQQLIPLAEWNEFLESGDFTRNKVTTFADNMGIAPGIVVGRLQHENKIGFNQLNDLRVRFIWAD